MMKKSKLVWLASVLLLLMMIPQWGIGQTNPVRGKVSDESGMPMAGVNVVIKGTVQGTITDADGRYQIEAPAGAVLSFPLLGTSRRRFL